MKETDYATPHTLIVILTALVFGATCLDPGAYAQERKDLEQRIMEYQQGEMPAGPTKRELQAEVARLTVEVGTLTAQLEACQNPPEPEAP